MLRASNMKLILDNLNNEKVPQFAIADFFELEPKTKLLLFEQRMNAFIKIMETELLLTSNSDSVSLAAHPNPVQRANPKPI